MKAYAINTLPADTTPPTSSFSAPPYLNIVSSTQAAGTASDASGIKRVTVRLRRIQDWVGNNDFKWWDGSSWEGSPTEFLATGTTSWTWNTPYLSDGKYAMEATATDTQGNSDSTPTNTLDKYFLVDTTAPAVNITSPVNNASFSTFPTVNGSVSDNSDETSTNDRLSRVDLVITRSNGEQWNGSAWVTSGGKISATVSGNSWSVSSGFPTGSNLSGGTYALKAVAYDKAGNSGTDDDTQITILGNVAPVNESVVHLVPGGSSSGTSAYGGVPRLLKATYSDANGASDIKEVFLLINNTNAADSAIFVWCDVTNQRLYIRNNNSTGWIGPVTIGTPGALLSNSFGSLDCGSTSVSLSGNTVTVNWYISPKASLIGTNNIYMQVRDFSNAATQLEDKGDWTITDQSGGISNAAPVNYVMYNVPPPPGVSQPLIVSSSVNTDQLLGATHSDRDGGATIADSRIVMKHDTTVTSSTFSDSLFAWYDRSNLTLAQHPNGLLYLRNRNNTAWLGGIEPGTPTTPNVIVQSTDPNVSLGSLNCAQTALVLQPGSTKYLSINWTLKPTANFITGYPNQKNLFLRVGDNGSPALFSAWDDMGDWTITNGAGLMAAPASEPVSSATITAEDDSEGETTTLKQDANQAQPLAALELPDLVAPIQYSPVEFESLHAAGGGAAPIKMQLRFNGALALAHALNAGNFVVHIEGVEVPVSAVSLSENGKGVDLILDASKFQDGWATTWLNAGALQTQTRVWVYWKNLHDAAGAPLQNGFTVLNDTPDALGGANAYVRPADRNNDVLKESTVIATDTTAD